MWDTDENQTRKETKRVMGLRERETRSRGGSMKVSRDLKCGCGVEVPIWQVSVHVEAAGLHINASVEIL